jgi:hypothetical protein
VGDYASLEFDQFGLGDAGGAEDGDARQGTADHGDFVAGVEAGAGLAVLVDLVGQCGAVDDAEAEVEEEVGDAGEEADGGDLLFFGFGEEGAEEFAAGSLALGFGLDDDGADFGEVRAVEVEGSAAEEDVGLGFGYGEVADVLADLGVVAAEEGAVAGEGVDEVEDVDGVRELCGAHGGSVDAGARRRGGVTDRHQGRDGQLR